MSYCRFSSGDVYLYPSIYGGIECCACRLADKVNTIFTEGVSEERTGVINLFGEDVTKPCKHCNGKGCDKCMMYGSITLFSRSSAIEHLEKHIEAGHKVPPHAFEYLNEEIEKIGDTKGLEVPDESPSPVLSLKTGKRIPLDEL